MKFPFSLTLRIKDFYKEKEITIFHMHGKLYFVSFAKSVVSGQLNPGLSSYRQSSLGDSRGIHNQCKRSIDRKPPTQPAQHVALSDQTGPDSLKKVQRV